MSARSEVQRRPKLTGNVECRAPQDDKVPPESPTRSVSLELRGVDEFWQLGAWEAAVGPKQELLRRVRRRSALSCSGIKRVPRPLSSLIALDAKAKAEREDEAAKPAEPKEIMAVKRLSSHGKEAIGAWYGRR